MRLNLVLSAAGLVATGWVVSTTTDVVGFTQIRTTTDTEAHLIGMAVPTTCPVVDEVLIAGTMRTDKKAYRHGDVLEVNFSMPHGPYLAIRTPSGRFFYVVFPSEQAVEKLVPLVDSRRFSTMSSLRLDTKTLKADPYTYGVLENKPVFTETGTYTLIMGHNLHVDNESELALHQVKYSHERAAGSQKSPAKNKKTKTNKKKRERHHDVAAL